MKKTCKNQVFGTPLNQLLVKSATNEVPIVTSMVNYLFEKGLTEGIFRVSPSQTELNKMKQEINSGKQINFAAIQNSHLVAGLFKAFLRELPDKLLSYQEILNIHRQKASDEEKVVQYSNFINTLPAPEVALMSQIFELLYFLNEHKEVTLMDARNLAICVSPALFKHLLSNVSDMGEVCRISEEGTSIVKFLIENYGSIFKAREEKVKETEEKEKETKEKVKETKESAAKTKKVVAFLKKVGIVLTESLLDAYIFYNQFMV